MISQWMYEHFLNLNASKTKILIVIPPSLNKTIVLKGTFINGNCVRFVNCAKNLGVILDAELSFKQQIMNTVKSCFFTIQKLSKIKSFLSYEHLKTLVSACIFS